MQTAPYRGGPLKLWYVQHLAPPPLWRDDNISIADCMPLSSILKSVKINGGSNAGVYKKLAIVYNYLVHHC